MVRIDVDDKHVVELALLRLLARVGEQPGGVELLDRNASAAVGNEVHGASPDNDVEPIEQILCLLSARRKRVYRNSSGLFFKQWPRGAIRFG
jgi:hypothetical protein